MFTLILIQSWSEVIWGTTDLAKTESGLFVITKSRRVADVEVTLVGTSIICTSLLLFKILLSLLPFKSKSQLKSPKI